MKKKKSTKTQPTPQAISLKLDLNGKTLVIFDTDEWGPIELRLDDKEVALEVLRVIIKHTGNISNVDSYTKAEGKKLKKMVEGNND